MKLTMSDVRSLALRAQGLDGGWDLSPDKQGIAETVDRLGYVQIDTISVVRRAHDHTLWVRKADYDEQMLHQLQAEDRRVFEWWAPAMSYVPMHDYRYYAPRMKSVRPWKRKWYAENEEVVEYVLDRIRAEGPLSSSDFKAPEGFNRGTWWSWKPAKEALECLFDMGELMVSERHKFQRVYDLRERVLPDWVDTSEPTAEEMGRWVARRELSGLGFAPVGDVRWGRWRGQTADEAVVRDLIDAGEVSTFEIEGIEEQIYCARTENLDAVLHEQRKSRPVHILSPFDNLVIRRGWVKRYFGFDYKLEAYTPAAKRKYGYFSLPVLWGQHLVARMDAKADRKAKVFVVRGLFFEAGFSGYDELLPALAVKTQSLAAFAGCEGVTVEKVDPVEGFEPVSRALAS